MPFSSLMFFERRTQSSIKHRRLKYLLLFSLRCLFVALLVLAFARPYMHSTTIARASGGRTMVFAIDNSFSMRQGDRFANAKKAALDQINAMHRGRSRPGDFLRRPGETADRHDAGQAGAARGAGRARAGRRRQFLCRTLARAALHIGEPEDRYRRPRFHRSAEIFLPAELFRSRDWTMARSSRSIRWRRRPCPTGRWRTWKPRGASSTRRKCGRWPPIAGYNTPEATRKVTLLANGKPLETKAGQGAGQRPRHGRIPRARRALRPDALRNPIDGADPFPQDDHWLFSVERADPKPALLVHADGDTLSPLYVRTALESSSEAGFHAGIRGGESVG